MTLRSAHRVAARYLRTARKVTKTVTFSGAQGRRHTVTIMGAAKDIATAESHLRHYRAVQEELHDCRSGMDPDTDSDYDY